MSDLPGLGSRWVDTTGDDGVITVVSYDKGYVVAQGPSEPDSFIVQPGHFGERYRPAPGFSEDGEN